MPEYQRRRQTFWSWITSAILLPIIYIKIINAEQRIGRQNNQQSQKPQSPGKLSPLNHTLVAFFCFAIPLYLLAVFFGLTPYLPMLDQGQQYLRAVLLAGFLYVMVVFWRSGQFTQDDKLFWTLGVLFSVPIGLPLLYVKKFRLVTLKRDEGSQQS